MAVDIYVAEVKSVESCRTVLRGYDITGEDDG